MDRCAWPSLMDMKETAALLEAQARVTGVPITLMDSSGKILIACGDGDARRALFQAPGSRLIPQTSGLFRYSDSSWGIAVPVQAEGEILATLFMTPFQLRDDVGGSASSPLLESRPESRHEATERLPELSRIQAEHLVSLAQALALLLSEKVLWSLNGTRGARTRAAAGRDLAAWIIEGTPHVVCGLAPDGTIRFINPSGEQITGYTSDELLGRNWWETFYPGEEYRQVERLFRDMARQDVRDYEMILTAKNGRRRTIIWNSINRLNPDESLLEVIGFGQDVTDQKQAEQALRDSEAMFRTLFESAGDAIFLMSGDSFLQCNRKTLEMFGCRPDEILSQNPDAFSPPFQPDGRPSSEKATERIRAALDGTPQHFKWLHCRRDGTPFEAEVTLNRIEIQGRRLLQAIVRDVTTRNSALMALRESEGKYRQLVEQLNEGLVILDTEMRVTLANARMADMLGYEVEELAGLAFTELMDEGLRDGFRQRIMRRLEGLPEPYELELRRKNGEELFCFVSGTPVRDATGKITGATGVFTDITHRRKAERALQESEENFRSVFANMQDVFYRSDLQGNIVMVSPSAARLLGYPSAEALIGKSIANDLYLIPSERQRILDALREHGSVNGFECVLKHTDGRPIIISTNSHICRDKEGRPSGVEGVLVDITERKRIEGERQRLASAIEQVSDAIMITDTAGVILYANAAMSDLSGIPLKDLVGRDMRTVGHDPRQDPAVYQDTWEQLARGEAWRGRMHQQREDGTAYDTDTTLSPVRGTDGRVLCIVFSSRDVTRELGLENQLRQSQKMEAIGLLAGGIAHDFNNILMPILGYAELARYRVQSDPKTAGYVREIGSAAQRAADLVQQILTFSRHSEQVRKPVEISALVKESLRLIRAAVPATIAIRKEIPETCGLILGDPNQIHQVVMNLCTNAYHAMREKGGTLTVTLDTVSFPEEFTAASTRLRAGDYVRIRVADTGTGMDEETRKKIFLPFFTTKGVGEGTGLGLAIVHGIVTGAGGGVTVASEPGKGSVFSLFFPRLEGRVEEKHGQDPIPPLGSEHILVVDDEMGIGQMLMESLTLCGFRLTIQHSSLKALSDFQRDPGLFDLVLTDMVMPELTGIELAEAFRRIRPDIPLVLMTGAADVEERLPGLRTLFADVVRKPVPPGQLARILREVLDHRPVLGSGEPGT